MAKGKYKQWLESDNIDLLKGWARDGLTDAQIAQKIGIRRTTLYDWKNKYSDIADALKKGKEIVDIEVENALLKRAKGMTTKSTTYKMVKVDAVQLKARRNKRINELKFEHEDWTKEQLIIQAAEDVKVYESIPMTTTKTELPPDISAAIFWLKNRKPEVFRDQSYRVLNDAQAKKASAEADIAKYKADMLSSAQKVEPMTFILPPIPEEEENETEGDGDGSSSKDPKEDQQN